MGWNSGSSFAILAMYGWLVRIANVLALALDYFLLIVAYSNKKVTVTFPEPNADAKPVASSTVPSFV